MASQSSDSNDNLDYPEVAIDPVYATVTSNVSGFSTDSLDPSWMDDLGFSGGVIQFVYDEASGQKANAGLYVSVPEAADADDVATYMAKVWKKRTPNIILSLITSNRHYKHWKDQDLVHDFQTGIITAANTTEMWILTNGFDGGITKILGDAFKDEKQRRKIQSLTKTSMKFVNNQKQENLPKLTVIGVVPKCLLSYNSKIDSTIGPVNIQNKGQKPLSDKQELNSDHTHYIMLDGVSDLRGLENFRIKLEERFLTPVGRPKRYRKITNLSDSVLNVGESVPDDLQIISSTCTPMVGLLVQGGPLEMDHVAELLKRNVPVVVMKGTGLAADLISFAYLEIQERPHPEHIESYVKPELIKKLMKYFPVEFKEDEIARNRCRDKILECAQNAHQGEQKFLTILSTDGASSDLKNLDKYLLLALFKSQPLKRGRKFQEQFQCDLKLTLDWNRCDLAVSQIFQKYDWARIKITHELFDRALLKKGREEFVDLFLSRDAIQVHKYLNHRKLLYLFNNLENEEFFLTVCLDGALSKASYSAYPLDKDFIIGDDCDFNQLLYRVTFLQRLVSSYELSMNSVGSYVTDQEVAERRAINTLVFWAAITFNPELTKVLWKRTEDPMVMALLVSMIWNNLSKNSCRDLDTKRKVRESAIDFGKMAVKLLDLAYKDSSVIAINALGKKLPDFNDKTVIEIAHIARNKFFIAHTICQKWLDKRWNGKLQIRELELGPFKVADWLMLYLSVFLVFPMFLWITYDVKNDAKDETDLDDSDDEILPDEAGMLQPLSLQGEKWQQKRHSVKYQMRKMLSYGRQNLSVPVHMQFYYLYSAPITKFWISQLFYILYLTIFSLAVLFPSCGNLHMDFVVFGWTLLIWVELVRGVLAKKKKYLEINLFWTKMEIGLIGIFLITFCLVRIVPHFVSYIDYMTTKFVMSLGLLYFYYRTLQVFLPISPVLGPMLINIRRMIKKDFLTWMRMFLIIMVSGGVTIHATLYPNYPFTMQGIKKALTRAFFAMFIAQIDDLEGNDSCSDLYKNTSLSHCRAISPDIFSKNASSTTRDDVTLLDTCPYSSMGGYLIIMQYFVITKLVMITLLYALFSATTAKVRGESEEIWKFQKYSLIVDFEERLRLPPPLSFISYLCMMSAGLYRCVHRCCTNCCRRPRGCCRCTCRQKKVRTEKDCSKMKVMKVRRTEDYNYWRSSIKDLTEMEDQEKANLERPITQSKNIGVVMAQMEKQKHFNGKLTEQMARLERNVTTCNLALEQIKHLLDKQQGQKNLSVAMKKSVVHVSSRQSPYPGTIIQRFPVFDKHVSWEVPYLGYDPVVYTCPVEEFVEAIQSLVDPDFLQIKRTAEKLLSREDIRTQYQPSALYNPMWNVSATLKINDTLIEINRASWISQNSTACRYSIDKTNLPLNPMGRTGIRGRGKLWRWGPNHSVLVVLSRWKEKYKQDGVESPERDYILIEGKRVLEMIVIQRLDTAEFTLPGGNDYGNMSMYSALCRRFQQFVLEQETTKTENMTEQDMINFFSKYSVPGTGPNTGLTSGVIYKGYIDDPSNTDNAWREAEVWNLHYRGGSILDDVVKEKEKKWKEASSYTKLYGNQDMIVKEAALLHGAYY